MNIEILTKFGKIHFLLTPENVAEHHQICADDDTGFRDSRAVPCLGAEQCAAAERCSAGDFLWLLGAVGHDRDVDMAAGLFARPWIAGKSAGDGAAAQH